MSFPRYPEYKDSGVEWLGEVPTGWRVVPLGRITKSRCDGPFGSGLKSEDYANEGARVIRLQNIRSGEFYAADSAFIPLDYFEGELQGHEVIAGDVLIAGLGDDNNSVGRACVAPDDLGPALVKADCFRFRLDAASAVPSFVALQLSAGAESDAGRLATGTTRSRIPLSATASRRIALPPRAEQTAIAAFLDRETAKIDALVAEQERLIALLKEKRQAVISHAVTKGLDPNAPMKPSGIEWMGEVPVHWKVKPLKRLVSSIEQGWSPQCEGFPAEGDEWAVLKVGAVNGGSFSRTENKVLPAELVAPPELGLKAGDLLISRANTRELVGSAAVVPVDEPRLLLCDKLFRIRFSAETADSRFIAFVLSTPGVRGQIELEATGASASMVNIGQSTILEMPVAFPASPEQSRIVESVGINCRQIDQMTQSAADIVLLLKERRAALISAAVTGQIDVRGVAD